MSIICPVCIEPLVVSSESHVVSPPCGHVFHSQCLANWLKEKCSCPTCRTKVKESHVKRLYLEFGTLSNGHSDEVAPYVCQVESLSFELKMKKREMENYKEKAVKDEGLKKSLRDEINKLETKVRRVKCDYVDALNAQESMRTEMKNLRECLKEKDKLKQDLENYKNLDKILYGSIETADSILKSNEMDPDNLIMLVSSFKTAFEDAKQSAIKKDKLIQRLTTENVGYKSKLENQVSQMSTLERVIETYKKRCNYDSPISTCSNTRLETSLEQDHLEPALSSDSHPSSSTSPKVLTPKFRPPDNLKKFSVKRKSDLSPILNRKIKIVSSRLKRPQT